MGSKRIGNRWRSNVNAKRQSDVHEKDKLLYKKTAKLYNQFAKKKIMAPWVMIDATQTPQDEALEILKIILKDLERQR